MSNLSSIFPIVGVGASAGGIESFRRFLANITSDSGMAYVLVQHLDPSHESLLPELLSKATRLPVEEIADNVQVLANHVYILPANKMVSVTDHILKLSARGPEVPNMPIDLFFNSLAEVHKTLAVGVVLSGTAHDGTMGLKNIKGYGGITFAENPETATWRDMPQNAIDAGVVDFVLSPEDIATKLLKINAVYKHSQLLETDKLPRGQEQAFRQILSLISLKNNVDFNYYKQPTSKRRIARRMAINQSKTLNHYLEYLREDTKEQDALFQDMLIQVTSFFREEKTFDELWDTVFPTLLKHIADGASIRIWVAGCATGEEAYSLAILLHEYLQKTDNSWRLKPRKVLIFASDLSETAIEKARKGIYEVIDLRSISEERLQDYFFKVNDKYQVKQKIRELIVFASHNFLKDPPFAKMDLISCRNVFIYLEPILQKKALNTFHYALNENGFLVLGQAESSGAAPDLFSPISKHEKIYSRKQGASHFLPLQSKVEHMQMNKNTNDLPTKFGQQEYRKAAEQILISKHTPPSVIIDEQLEIVFINGNVSPFLKPPSGRPTFDLLKMSRKGLGFELRNTIHKVKISQVAILKEGIHIQENGKGLTMSLEVIPLPDTTEPFYLILFHQQSTAVPGLVKIQRKWNRFWSKFRKNELRVQNDALQKELAAVREDMGSITEDQDAINEELQSSNEELLSSNEEMQSLNEELETSKEELQSTNEELNIINQELSEKQAQLNEQLEYNEAILVTLRESIIVLDKNLRIRSANPSFYLQYGIAEQNIEGALFFSIQDGRWNDEKFKILLEKVLPEKRSIVDFEIELILSDGIKHSLQLNAREMIDSKKDDKLLLLAIEDITEWKEAVSAYQKSIKELTQVNQQLDQFVHVASHDLQEPLRKIMIFIDRLRHKNEGHLSQEIITDLEKIENSSKRMSTLIQDLLNYSLVGDNKQLFEMTDLSEVLSDVMPDFELLIEQKKAQIHFDALPTISAIPLQMRQLFYNLISNALKFSKKGIPPKINISSRYLESDKIDQSVLDPTQKYVEVIVKDNGIGFDEKYKAQIFGIFQRLNQRHLYMGTGIGLALVKRIVENHHGTIFVKAKEDEGAEFHIILPIDGAAW